MFQLWNEWLPNSSQSLHNRGRMNCFVSYKHPLQQRRYYRKLNLNLLEDLSSSCALF